MFKVIAFLFFFTLTHLTFSQQQFEGEYVFNGLKGVGKLTYILGENNRAILDGDFEFERDFIDSLDKRNLQKLRVNGSYEKNKKVGEWRYKEENHKLIFKDVIDFNPEYKLESNSILLQAKYENGIPHGEWEYLENKLDGGKILLDFHTEEIHFSKGELEGKLNIKDYDGENVYYIVGNGQAEGIMDGNWDFVYPLEGRLIKETRRYEDGILIGINKVDVETEETIQEVIYYNTISKLKNLADGEKVNYKISDRKFGLTYDDGFRDLSNEFRGQAAGNMVLEEALVKLLRFDTLYISKDNKIKKYPIHTKRFEYEVDELDQELIAKLEKEFNKLENDVNSYASRNSLALNRTRNDSLSFYYEFFQYYQNKLQTVKKVIDILTSDEINFIDQSNFSKEGFDFLTTNDVIYYELGDSVLQKEITYDYHSNEEQRLAQVFRDYISEKQSIVDSLGTQISGLLTQYEQNEELLALEKVILEKKNQFDSLYNTYVPETSEEAFIINSLRQNFLVEGFNNLNKEFSDLENYEEVINKGKEIDEMLNTFKFAFDSLPALLKTFDEIEAIYTDITLDPFTFNENFRVLRKRRLVEAARLVYQDYIRRIQIEKDYTKLQDYYVDVQNLLFRMKELRSENTNRLERRISSQTDVEQIKKLLEL